MEYSFAYWGDKIAYDRKRQKRSYVNDGRAPDTTELLIGSRKRKKIGRPQNAVNLAPSGKR